VAANSTPVNVNVNFNGVSYDPNNGWSGTPTWNVNPNPVVVPPSQAELMVQALRAKGLPHAYLLFEGEQHGFRRAETIRTALEAELSFYRQILDVPSGDGVPELAIEGRMS